MKRNIIILSIILLCIETITACECTKLPFDEEVRQSDQIFIGKVLKKDSIDRIYYTFLVTDFLKGAKLDTIKIKTGFGGGDCGMNFIIGKTYLVFSSNKETDRCRRNSLLENSADIGKLKYVFRNDFASKVGCATDTLLNDNEAEYFNSELIKQREQQSNFDFYNKRILFLFNEQKIDKKQYFKNWGGQDVSNQLIVLTREEKQLIQNCDAIIISWRKEGISKSFRKKLIDELKKK